MAPGVARCGTSPMTQCAPLSLPDSRRGSLSVGLRCVSGMLSAALASVRVAPRGPSGGARCGGYRGGVDRRALGSWLMAPGQAPELIDTREQDYRGQRLGLPESGPGSVSPVARRVIALAIDWLAAMVVASFFAGYGSDGYALVTLAIFAVQTVILVELTGVGFGAKPFLFRELGSVHFGKEGVWSHQIVAETSLLDDIVPDRLAIAKLPDDLVDLEAVGRNLRPIDALRLGERPVPSPSRTAGEPSIGRR